MVGLLLSDGYKSYSARSKNGYLSLTQSLSNPYYVYFVYNILSHYCTRYPVFRERHRYGRSIFSLEIHTRSILCITELYILYK
jgi:hypothetical protein